MKFILKILLNTKLTHDISISILNIYYNNSWFDLLRKMKVRINALGFNVLNILGEPYKLPVYLINGIDKKNYYLKNCNPLLPKSIKLIKDSIKYSDSNKLISYKIKIISNCKIKKYITFYNNGSIIWDNDHPRISLSGI